MASEGAGKVRAKRYNDHGKPYERRRSIIGIFTDTVKGMFKSTWSSQDDANKISPGTSQDGNGRQAHNNVQHKTGQNNTHGLDNNLGQSYIQPPAMSTTGPGPSKHHPQMPIGMSQIPSQQMTRPEPVNFTSDQLPFVQYQGKPASLIVNGGDDRSELSECSVSTSGCSSMAPHHDKKEFQLDMLRHPESRIHQMRQELGGSITPSKELEGKLPKSTDIRKIPERSFMWSGHSPATARRPPHQIKSNTPSFNISIFGSSHSADRSIQNRSGHNDSIFYSGKTTYGGFSSQKKRKLQEVSPQQVTPNKRQVKAKPLSSNVSGISSSSARRILSTLERMSSPLNDAKKIPSYNSSLVDSPLSFTPSSFSSLARRKSMPYRSSSVGLLKGPPVHSLNTPGTVQIAKNFNNSQYLTPVSQESPSKSTTSSSCAVTGTQTAQSYTEPSSSATRPGKMKHSRGQHYSNKKDEDEVVEVPDLPTEFTLPVSSMPQFDFKSPSVMSTPLPESTHVTKSVPLATVQKAENGPFTFSTPIPKSQPEKSHHPLNVQNFQFSSPINIDNASSSTGKVSAAAEPSFLTKKDDTCVQDQSEKPLPKPNLAFKFDPTTAKRKSISPEEGLSSSKIQSFSATPQQSPASLQATPELISGSVMDILGGSKKRGKTDDASKVIQAETKSQLTSVPIDSAAPSLSELFKKPTGSWECPTCMMQNKADAATCPACMTSKPGSTSGPGKTSTDTALPTPSVPVENSLATLFKKDEGTWECDTCMVLNKPAATKCIACETSKPGVKKATSFTSAGGFKIGPTGGFQFGAPIPNVATEQASTTGGMKFSQNATDTDQNAKSTSGGFKFGASLETGFGQKNSGADQAEGTGTKSDQPLSGGFQFGSSVAVPVAENNTTGSSASGGFKFGASLTAKSDNSSKDINSVKSADNMKAQDSGKADTTEGAVPSVGGFAFGATLASGKQDSVPSTQDNKVPSGGFTFGAQSNKVETTQAEVKPQQTSGLFSFGAPVSSGASSSTDPAESKTTNFQATVPSATSSSNTNATGGISFTSNNIDNKPAFSTDGAQKKKELAGPAVPSTGIFAFGQQPNKEQSSVGFAFGSQAKSENTGTEITPAAPGFGLNTPILTGSSNVAISSSANSGTFAFGSSAKPAEAQAANAPAPFAFGVPKSQAGPPTSSVQSSSLFMFGQAANKPTDSSSTARPPAYNFSAATKPAATTPQSQTATTGMFFTAKPAETAATTTTAAAAPAGNMFSFTGKPGQDAKPTPNLFAFGAKPPQSFGGKPVQDSLPVATSILGKRPVPGESVTAIFGDLETNKADEDVMLTSVQHPDSDMSSFDQKLVTSSSGVFVFTGNTTSSTTSSAFAFGQGNQPSVTSTVPAFGTQSTGPSNSFGGFTKSASSPAFGTAAKTSAANMFGTSTNTTTPSFGGSAVPAFGTSNSAAPPPFGSSSTTSGPAFGTTSTASAFGTTMTTPATAFGNNGTPAAFGAPSTNTSFQFGTQQPTQGTGSMFQFGGQQQNQPTNSMFQASQSTPQASTGFNFNQATQPAAQTGGSMNFNFNSAGPASPPQPQGSFQFNAAATPVTPAGGSNPFSVAVQPRRVKKAARKLRK